MTVAQRTCPIGASEGENESGGGSDAMAVDDLDRHKADFPRTCLSWKRSWAGTGLRDRRGGSRLGRTESRGTPA